MKNLLKKEFTLSMHPVTPFFLLLSAMMLIPNYPYYVVFFYTGLSIFFTCLSGRENNDIFYSMLLPVNKKSIVSARFLFVIIIELLQFAVAVPFAILRQNIGMGENAAGMEAGIALFGLSFIMMGLFNFVFLGLYYKNVKKVGTAFVWSSIVVFAYIVVAEVMAHVVPFFRDVLDTSDTEFVGEKLIVLAVGVAVYALFTFIVYKKSLKRFVDTDI